MLSHLSLFYGRGQYLCSGWSILGHSPVSAVPNLVSKTGFEAVRDILTRSMSDSVDKHDAMQLGMGSAVPHSEARVCPAVET